MIYGLLFVFSLGDGTLVSFVEKEIPALSKAVEESVMFELLVSILSMCVGLFIILCYFISICHVYVVLAECAVSKFLGERNSGPRQSG